MEEWNIIGGQIKLKSGRIHSANADCVHVNGSKFGPWIENCLFEGYSDDAINMKAIKVPILEQKSPTELVVKQTVTKGDVIRIFNPREGVLIGAFEVIQNKFLGNAKMHITLNKPIEQKLEVGDSKTNDLGYLDTQSNESFVIRNNTFRNARRYGILLQNSYGVIERNLFQNLSQSGITINNGVDWGEGFVAHDIIINQNIFNNCGYDDTYLKEYDAAAIRMRVTKLKDLETKGKWNGVATSDWQGLENISVTNNTFLYNKRALSIECSVNTVVRGNKFIRNLKDLSEKSEILLKNNNTNLVFDN
jgi:cytolysin (calcineurin-like family phosphatase)